MAGVAKRTCCTANQTTETFSGRMRNMPRTTRLRPAACARDRLVLFLIFGGVRGTSRENVGALVAMVRNEVEGRQRKGKAMEREVDTAEREQRPLPLHAAKA